MKRIKTFFAVALICAMGTVGYNAYADANMTAQERLLLANVEALTTSEPGGGSGCEVSLACSMVNAPQNTIKCNGKVCKRNAAERWVECDNSRTYC